VHLACATYLGALFHQRARPYRLPVISFVLRVCRNALCSCPCSQAGFCMHVDEPSVIGLSIRTRSHHNCTGVQVASLRLMVVLRGAQTTQKSKSRSGVFGCIIYICRERDPRVPVGLILTHVVSKVLSQHSAQYFPEIPDGMQWTESS
jgi:hypothetical protein